MMSNNLVDPIDTKIKKIAIIIISSSILMSILYSLAFFIIGNAYIGNKLLTDSLIIPFIIGGVSLCGVTAGLRIKETKIGKIIYALLTLFLSIIPMTIAVVLPTAILLFKSF